MYSRTPTYVRINDNQSIGTSRSNPSKVTVLPVGLRLSVVSSLPRRFRVGYIGFSGVRLRSCEWLACADDVSVRKMAMAVTLQALGRSRGGGTRTGDRVGKRVIGQARLGE